MHISETEANLLIGLGVVMVFTTIVFVGIGIRFIMHKFSKKVEEAK